MSTLLLRHNFYIKWSMTSKVIQGHIRLLFCQNHSGTFFYGLILMKICMNANNKKTQIFHKIIENLKISSWLITSLIRIEKDNSMQDIKM